MKDKLIALGLSIVAVFAPIQAMIITTGVLIGADLIVGIWAASKQGHPITSAGIRRTVTKMFIYETALLLGFLAEHYLLSDLLPATKIVSGMIGITELKSIYENLNTISGSDLLKTAIAKLGSENDSSPQ